MQEHLCLLGDFDDESYANFIVAWAWKRWSWDLRWFGLGYEAQSPQFGLWLIQCSKITILVGTFDMTLKGVVLKEL